MNFKYKNKNYTFPKDTIPIWFKSEAEFDAGIKIISEIIAENSDDSDRDINKLLKMKEDTTPSTYIKNNSMVLFLEVSNSTSLTWYYCDINYAKEISNLKKIYTYTEFLTLIVDWNKSLDEIMSL